MTIDHPPSIMNSPIIDLSKEPPVLGISKNSLKELIVSSGFFIFYFLFFSQALCLINFFRGRFWEWVLWKYYLLVLLGAMRVSENGNLLVITLYNRSDNQQRTHPTGGCDSWMQYCPCKISNNARVGAGQLDRWVGDIGVHNRRL